MVGLNMCDWTSCSSETFTAKYILRWITAPCHRKIRWRRLWFSLFEDIFGIWNLGRHAFALQTPAGLDGNHTVRLFMSSTVAADSVLTQTPHSSIQLWCAASTVPYMSSVEQTRLWLLDCDQFRLMIPIEIAGMWALVFLGGAFVFLGAVVVFRGGVLTIF